MNIAKICRLSRTAAWRGPKLSRCAYIYIPNRNLFLQDKARYSKEEAEKEQLLQYVKEYMDVDPKKLSEKERGELLAKAKVIMEQQKKEEKERQAQGQSNQKETAGSEKSKEVPEEKPHAEQPAQQPIQKPIQQQKTRKFTIDFNTGVKVDHGYQIHQPAATKTMKKDEMSNEMKAVLGQDGEKKDTLNSLKQAGGVNPDERVPGVNIDQSTGKLDERILSPQKLKDIFDKMTEIDTNPNSKSSREFEAKMLEFERQNPDKRQGQITIKTMRKGKVRNVREDSFVEDVAGRRILVDKRIIKYGDVAFPEQDFVHVTAKEGSKEIKLATYRYAADIQSGVPKKGTVFFIHGMTDYAGRYAYLAQKFTNQGYDFVCMDQRGHGRSEGMPAYFESVQEQLVGDTLAFHDKAIEAAGNSKLPRFLLANSTGCLQAIELASSKEYQGLYSGMSLINPFFGFEDPDEAQRQISLMKTVTFFMKGANVPNFKPALNHNYFYEHWLADPLAPTNMPMKSHIALFNAVTKLQDTLRYPDAGSQQYFQSLAALPFLVFQGGSDRTSCTRTSKAFFRAVPMRDKNIIEYDECDHFLLADGDWVDIAAKDIISWQDAH